MLRDLIIAIILLSLTGLGLAASFQDRPTIEGAIVIKKPDETRYSIFTYGNTTGMVFHNATELEFDGPVVWFTHDGKRKFLSGNFWAEPIPNSQ